MAIDASPRARVADGEHGGVELPAQVPDQRLHRGPVFTEAVKDEHGFTGDRRNAPVGLEPCECCAAVRLGSLVHARLVGIEDPPVVGAGAPLEPPVVSHEFVGPGEAVGGE